MAHILAVILYQNNCVWFLHVNICYCDVVISQLVRVNAEVCNFRIKTACVVDLEQNVMLLGVEGNEL